MSRVNYRWWATGLNGGIHETSEPVDGKTVFATFGEARQELGDFFASAVTQYGVARYRARQLRKADMRDGAVRCSDGHREARKGRDD
jgi:hypothetical protein